MTTYNVTRVVPYSAEQIYAIAADVPSYRKFLPLVKASKIVSRQKLPGGIEKFEASITVAYRKLNISETFTSQVEADTINRVVTSTSSDGPIKSLKSIWKLKDLPGGKCEIDYHVDFQLKSKALQFFMARLFDMAIRRIFAAFEARARELYGQGAAA